MSQCKPQKREPLLNMVLDLPISEVCVGRPSSQVAGRRASELRCSCVSGAQTDCKFTFVSADHFQDITVGAFRSRSHLGRAPNERLSVHCEHVGLRVCRRIASLATLKVKRRLCGARLQSEVLRRAARGTAEALRRPCLPAFLRVGLEAHTWFTCSGVDPRGHAGSAAACDSPQVLLRRTESIGRAELLGDHCFRVSLAMAPRAAV